MSVDDDDYWSGSFKDLSDIVSEQFKNNHHEYEPTIEYYVLSKMRPNQSVHINYSKSDWEYVDILTIDDIRNIKLYTLGLLNFDEISTDKSKIEYINNYIDYLNGKD